MMRLPHFTYRSPRTVQEAADMLAAPGGAMLIAGGTDLLPNMKRRQQVPSTLIGLRRVAELRSLVIRQAQDERNQATPPTLSPSKGELTIGAGVTLTEIVHDSRIRKSYGALWQAASQVATPHLRNMGTLGGNLCLDTRCNYYDQNYEWRKSIDFCMKKDGDTCWVATGSPKCLAVSSTDTAPALIALDARVSLVSANGAREIDLSDLYQNDGMHYLRRRPDEILTGVHLPSMGGWRSVYWKLRRRGSFDFPVLSVAVAARFAKDDTIEDARIVLGAVASQPIVATAASAALVGQRLSDEVIAHTVETAARPAKPMDNTDFDLTWRKRVLKDLIGCALKELRGDDVREWRRKLSKMSL